MNEVEKNAKTVIENHFDSAIKIGQSSIRDSEYQKTPYRSMIKRALSFLLRRPYPRIFDSRLGMNQL